MEPDHEASLARLKKIRINSSEQEALRLQDATAIGFTVRTVARRFQPQVANTDVVVGLIDSFISISSFWTMTKACAKLVSSGNWRLTQLSLARVATYERHEYSDSKVINPYVKHKRFADSLVLATHHGNRDMINWLVEFYLPTGRVREAVGEAVRNGHWEVLKWLRENHDHRVMWTASDFKRDEWFGQSGMLRWLYELSVEKNIDAKDLFLDAAATSGELVLIHWGLSICEVFKSDKFINLVKTKGLISAARQGQIDTLDWAWEKFGNSIAVDLVNSACEGGQLKTVEWLMRKKKLTLELSALDKAISAKQWFFVMDVLNRGWVGQDPPYDYGTHWKNNCLANSLLDAAISHGEIKIVQSLLPKYTFSEEILCKGAESAASRGLIEMVEVLLAHPAMASSSKPISVTGAVVSGHIEVIQLLEEHHRASLILDPNIWGDTTRCIRENGSHFECASSPIGTLANHVETVNWLMSHHRATATEEMLIPCRNFLMTVIGAASRNGRLQIVELLHSECHDASGCLDAFYSASKGGHLLTMQWMHIHCSYVQTASLSAAVRNASQYGHVHIMTWLDSFPNRCQILPSIDYTAAAENGHVAFLDFCLRRDPETLVPAEAINAACAHGQLEVLFLIYSQNKAVKTHISDEALGAAPIEALQFLAASIALGFDYRLRRFMRSHDHRDRRHELELLGVL